MNKILLLFLFLLGSLPFTISFRSSASSSGNLAEKTKSKNLFNGRDLTGWHVDVPEMDNDTTALNPFIIRNGLLVSLGTPGGHLITNDSYKNYRLEIEYRFVDKPGNCGVLVHVSTPRALYEMFPKSIEVQMM